MSLEQQIQELQDEGLWVSGLERNFGTKETLISSARARLDANDMDPKV